MKRQIIIIHGGETFRTYREYLKYLKAYRVDPKKKASPGWKQTLGGKIGSRFEVIAPKMPNATNAKYAEWKIYFEKFFPFLKNNVILVGHSLGGVFLAKYLAQNRFPKKIKALFLIAPPSSDKPPHYLASFKLPKKLKGLKERGGNIFLYHSKDDKIVPFRDSKIYATALPNATLRVFANKGHFNQATFPKLVKEIKKIWG